MFKSFSRKLRIILQMVLLINLSLFCYSNVAHSNSIGKNVEVISVIKNKNSSYTIKYNLKKNYEKIENLKIGYEVDPRLRLNPYSVNMKKSKGTHSITIPQPKSIGYIKFTVWYSMAGRYGESNVIKEVFIYPVGFKSTTHIVTKADEKAQKLLFKYIPGFALELTPAKPAKYIGRSLLGFNFINDMVIEADMDTWLTPKAGQFITQKTWFSEKGYLYTESKLWSSEKAYKNDKTKTAPAAKMKWHIKLPKW
jgi:hypothetical protein